MAQWLRTALLRSSLDSATLISDAPEDSGAVLWLGWSPWKDTCHWRISGKKQSSTTTTHATWQPVAWLCSIQCMHCSFAPHSYHTEFSPTICLDSPWFPGHGASLTKSSLVRRLWNTFMPRIGRVAVLQPKCWAELMWHKDRICLLSIDKYINFTVNPLKG